jgi:hypothetical protein
LGGSTKVLTKRGWVSIVDVKLNDLLWDGEEWVAHEGLIYQGMKKTLSIAGIIATEDHRFLDRCTWVSAKEASRNMDTLSRILETGSLSLPLAGILEENAEQLRIYLSNAIAGLKSLKQLYSEYTLGDQLDAVVVQLEIAELVVKQPQALTTIYARIEKCERSLEQLLVGHIKDAQIQKMPPIKITVDGGLSSTDHGYWIGYRLWSIWYLLKDMMTLIKNSIELTTTLDTSPATSDLSAVNQTQTIEEQYSSLKEESENLNPVYDIANAGPRKRFTVLSDGGPVISHNCYTLARALCWESIDWSTYDDFTYRFNPSARMSTGYTRS